jgi:EAL domain-containing protein (putative c-di-GMP-specific phosphodiesterase class I)
MPGEFLPLIEHEDVIIGIGNWVIAEAPASKPGCAPPATT